MSQENFVRFLTAVRDDPRLLAAYSHRNLSQLLFHARNEGYLFNVLDVEQVIGKLEANVILHKDMEEFGGNCRLWRAMWGTPHLDYVVHFLLPRHTEGELAELIAPVGADQS